jgi:hypothetical protein
MNQNQIKFNKNMKVYDNSISNSPKLNIRKFNLNNDSVDFKNVINKDNLSDNSICDSTNNETLTSNIISKN